MAGPGWEAGDPPSPAPTPVSAGSPVAMGAVPRETEGRDGEERAPTADAARAARWIEQTREDATDAIDPAIARAPSPNIYAREAGDEVAELYPGKRQGHIVVHTRPGLGCAWSAEEPEPPPRDSPAAAKSPHTAVMDPPSGPAGQDASPGPEPGEQQSAASRPMGSDETTGQDPAPPAPTAQPSQSNANEHPSGGAAQQRDAAPSSSAEPAPSYGSSPPRGAPPRLGASGMVVFNTVDEERARRLAAGRKRAGAAQGTPSPASKAVTLQYTPLQATGIPLGTRTRSLGGPGGESGVDATPAGDDSPSSRSMLLEATPGVQRRRQRRRRRRGQQLRVGRPHASGPQPLQRHAPLPFQRGSEHGGGEADHHVAALMPSPLRSDAAPARRREAHASLERDPHRSAREEVERRLRSVASSLRRAENNVEYVEAAEAALNERRARMRDHAQRVLEGMGAEADVALRDGGSGGRMLASSPAPTPTPTMDPDAFGLGGTSLASSHAQRVRAHTSRLGAIQVTGRGRPGRAARGSALAAAAPGASATRTDRSRGRGVRPTGSLAVGRPARSIPAQRSAPVLPTGPLPSPDRYTNPLHRASRLPPVPAPEAVGTPFASPLRPQKHTRLPLPVRPEAGRDAAPASMRAPPLPAPHRHEEEVEAGGGGVKSGSHALTLSVSFSVHSTTEAASVKVSMPASRLPAVRAAAKRRASQQRQHATPTIPSNSAGPHDPVQGVGYGTVSVQAPPRVKAGAVNGKSKGLTLTPPPVAGGQAHAHDGDEGNRLEDV